MKTISKLLLIIPFILAMECEPDCSSCESSKRELEIELGKTRYEKTKLSREFITYRELTTNKIDSLNTLLADSNRINWIDSTVINQIDSINWTDSLIINEIDSINWTDSINWIDSLINDTIILERYIEPDYDSIIELMQDSFKNVLDTLPLFYYVDYRNDSIVPGVEIHGGENSLLFIETDSIYWFIMDYFDIEKNVMINKNKLY